MCVRGLRRILRTTGALLVVVSVFAGCPRQDGRDPDGPSANAEPGVVFSWTTTDGTEFGSATTRGRVTILLFLTTYDHASQLMARQLRILVHQRRPRINVGAVVLETPRYSVLAPVFKQSLELDYPVAMADEETLQGAGPFGALRRVPTLVVLDPRGRRAWQAEGYIPSERIESALDRIQGPSE